MAQSVLWWVHNMRAREMFQNTFIYECKCNRDVETRFHDQSLSKGQKGTQAQDFSVYTQDLAPHSMNIGMGL